MSEIFDIFDKPQYFILSLKLRILRILSKYGLEVDGLKGWEWMV